MRTFIIFLFVLFNISYGLTTIDYENGKVNIKNDGKIDYSLKIIMPTIDDEKQAIYSYLGQHAAIFNHQQHLIIEHVDNNILQKFLASYNLNTFTSVDFLNGKLTDEGVLALAQSAKFPNLTALNIADSTEITEIGQVALIRAFTKLENLTASVIFRDGIDSVLIKVNEFVRHGAEKLNLVFVPQDFSADPSTIQYTVAKFRFKPNRNHYDDRGGQSINTLVMHYTVGNFDRTMNTFTEDKPDGRVSAHWVITQLEEDSTIIKGGIPVSLVPEAERAWHAGIGVWQNISGINSLSIGIENVNKGWEAEELGKKWFPFDKEQIKTLGKLSKTIVNKHSINPTKVIGHADLAFNRKQDPGILFPWRELHEKYDVGAFLTADELNEAYIKEHYKPLEELPKKPEIEFFLKQLKKYGYDVKEDMDIESSETNQNAILAFKAHFSANGSPENYNTTLRYEDMLFAWGLVAKYHQYLS